MRYRIIEVNTKFRAQVLTWCGWRDIQYWSYKNQYQVLWLFDTVPLATLQQAIDTLFGYVVAQPKSPKRVVMSFANKQAVIDFYNH